MTGPNGARPPFSRARTAGGLLLLGLVVVLAIIDSIRTDFAVDSIQLGLLLGTALLLLGVEGGKWLLPRLSRDD